MLNVNMANLTAKQIEHIMMGGGRVVVKLWIDDFTKRYEFSFDGHEFMVEVFSITGGRLQVVKRPCLVALLVTLCFHHAECQY